MSQTRTGAGLVAGAFLRCCARVQGGSHQAVPGPCRWRRVEPLARAYLGNSLHLLGALHHIGCPMPPGVHHRCQQVAAAPGRPADGGRHAGAHAAPPAPLRGAAGLLGAPAAQVPAPRARRLPRRQPGGARARLPARAPGRAGAARAGPGRRAQGAPPAPAADCGLPAPSCPARCMRAECP